MSDFEFKEIAPRCGSKRDAFEELCCQLARRTLSEKSTFVRLDGSGGDGGVECFADLPDGSRIGWQAKFVDSIDKLIVQATKSLDTALGVHPSLQRYVVCFPFNLTGPTKRKGKSGTEKFAEWVQAQVEKANQQGRTLTIEDWPASRLRELILEHDTSGGLRAFFFNHEVLSPDWFAQHLDSMRATTGPRYTADLNVQTDLRKWFASFGRTSEWFKGLDDVLEPCDEIRDSVSDDVEREEPNSLSPVWPQDARADGQAAVGMMQVCVEATRALQDRSDDEILAAGLSQIDTLLETLRKSEAVLAADIKIKHGEYAPVSPGFRQFQAEYLVSFPAVNLDHVKQAIVSFTELREWLSAPIGSLASKKAFVLTGIGGSGKTHGVCDCAEHRFKEGMLSCVVFGHVFSGNPDPWTRMLESLGLPIALGKDGFLDCLNSAGEASGSPVFVFIDAIDDTRPLNYWRDRLPDLVQAFASRPWLRLCMTCKSSFVPYCVPDLAQLLIVEHRGFDGVEQLACKAFFDYYDLQPPVFPILQPEFGNPLYLKLVCHTLQSKGIKYLPPGWIGLSAAIQAFLEEKENQFTDEKGISIGARVMTGSLQAIARTLAESGETQLSWTRAEQVAQENKPQALNLGVVDWLVKADLLIEDMGVAQGPLKGESTLRPAFGRLGDFLVASELLERIGDLSQLESAVQPGGELHALVENRDAIDLHDGALSALSILIPEQMWGIELSESVEAGEVRDRLRDLTVRSLPWRDPAGFSQTTKTLVVETLTKSSSPYAFDAILAIAWQPSVIDSFWLDGFLGDKPLVQRDSVWCRYLHDQFESGGVVDRLIDAAFEIAVADVDVGIAERWATELCWFAAAADRRVKDNSSRGVVALLSAHPTIIQPIVSRFLSCNDEEIVERVLLVAYGALINSGSEQAIKETAISVYEAFTTARISFDNALIRDHIRSILSLAAYLGVLPEDMDPDESMKPLGTAWPLELPSDADIEQWRDFPKLVHSCMQDDFYIYSMNCLRDWEQDVDKSDMSKWILQTAVLDFEYEESGAERYDWWMLSKYGGGRGKPNWAERIGKKYQWIAMYRLASRLHDHAERKLPSWEPTPQGTPLILVEERKFDPTFPARTMQQTRDEQWLDVTVSVDSEAPLPDEEWVAKEDDLPELDQLLKAQLVGTQHWIPLSAYLQWDNRPKSDGQTRHPYRDIWISLDSYLVKKDVVDSLYEGLHRRNFFGNWMPNGSSWLGGFIGEYPWAIPFNIEPDSWHSREPKGNDLPPEMIPTHNEVVVEWEYDASLPSSFHARVPTRPFFEGDDLWWDGEGGYRSAVGNTIFIDPSLIGCGPQSLLVDVDELSTRLEKLGLALIWTVLGEKWILGGSSSTGPRPQRTFSQIARLMPDGSIAIGDRVFFDDYNQDVGLAPAYQH